MGRKDGCGEARLFQRQPRIPGFIKHACSWSESFDLDVRGPFPERAVISYQTCSQSGSFGLGLCGIFIAALAAKDWMGQIFKQGKRKGRKAKSGPPAIHSAAAPRRP